MTRLHLGRSAVYQLIRSRRLASMTIGRCRRIPTHALDEFITRETDLEQEPS
jgi:excisionase family DNA binding protein